MIALKQNMPKHCLECPCLQTFDLPIDSDPTEYSYLLRFCAAKKQEIIVLEWCHSESPTSIWMDFKKPDWCPWIEI